MNRRTSKLVCRLLCAILCAGTIAAQSIDQKRTDGPISVDLGEVFNRAPIKIEDVELAKLPALPRGYAALNNKAYRDNNRVRGRRTLYRELSSRFSL